LTPNATVKRKKVGKDRIYVVTTPDRTIECYSVTTVLKIVAEQSLAIWKQKVGYRAAYAIATEAGKFGDKVHDICDALNKGGHPKVPRLMRKQIDNYKAWAEDKVILASEERVYSLEHEYAGCTDIIGQDHDGHVFVADVKTGTIHIRPVRMQLGAYLKAVKEMFPELNPEYRVILPLSRKDADKKFKARMLPMKNNEADFQAFLNLLGYYRWLKTK
jgi:hypothetical protein